MTLYNCIRCDIVTSFKGDIVTLQIGEGPATREPERRDAVFMTLITRGLFFQNQVNCDQSFKRNLSIKGLLGELVGFILNNKGCFEITQKNTPAGCHEKSEGANEKMRTEYTKGHAKMHRCK